jgi:cytochrome c-type biogenesis protein CcmH
MTVFWVLSALLAVGALALTLRPLLRRSGAGVSRDELNVSVYRDQLRELDADLRAGTLAQADHERSRRELERRMLEDVEEKPAAGKIPPAPTRARSIGIFAAAAIPLVSLAVYFAVGSPGALDPRPQAAQDAGMAQIEAMVDKLAERLAQNPEDLEGWRMLGRSYTVLGRFAEAASAYAKAAARSPRDPQLLADLADAIAMSRGQSMKGEPEELVLRALQIDPNNLKALALAGTAAYDRGNFRAAARYWERMLPHVAPDSEDARTIQANVDEAKTRAASKPAAKGANNAVRGTVSLSPALAAKASPDDTVFIFARAAEGPPMPLAVLRKRVRDLPVTFSLDDSMAMTPAAKLSAFPRIIVGARISKSGNATPQTGDLQGTSAPVANTASGVKVTIDTVVPAK